MAPQNIQDKLRSCNDFEISHHCKWSAGYRKHSLLRHFRNRRYCLGSQSLVVGRKMSDNCAVKDAETREENHHSESSLTETLTDGFLDAFVPSLKNLKERLGELTQNQGILIETMQQENAKFVECHSARNLLVMLSYVRTYHSKLTKIQHDMDVIEDRVVRLQKRAMKLKSQKEKEERNRVEAQERQLELERQLTAKLASDHPQ